MHASAKQALSLEVLMADLVLHLARIVGQKKAREIWYLCDQYDARKPLIWASSIRLFPDQLEETYVAWARKILKKSPLAIRMLKCAFNAELDGQAGIQELAGNATLLYYLSDEAKEGKKMPFWRSGNLIFQVSQVPIAGHMHRIITVVLLLLSHPPCHRQNQVP